MIWRIRAGRYDVGIDLRGDLRRSRSFDQADARTCQLGPHGGTRLLTHTWPFDPTLHEWKRISPSPAARRERHRKTRRRGACRSVHTIARDVARRREGSRICRLRAARIRAESCVARGARGGGCQRRASRAGTRERLRWQRRRRAAWRRGRAIGELANRQSGRAHVTHGDTVGAAPRRGDRRGRFRSDASGCGGRITSRRAVWPGDPRECRPWSDTAQIVAVGAPCGCLHPTRLYGRAGSLHAREIGPDMAMRCVPSLHTAQCRADRCPYGAAGFAW